MTLNALKASLRHAWAYGRRCGDCGCSWPEALERTRYGVLCRACRLRRDGHRPVERHHALGRDVNITVPLHANLHAKITALEAVYERGWWARCVLAWAQCILTWARWVLDWVRWVFTWARCVLAWVRAQALRRVGACFYQAL